MADPIGSALFIILLEVIRYAVKVRDLHRMADVLAAAHERIHCSFPKCANRAMTFRIETVSLAEASNTAWRLRAWFKGLHGKGEFGNAEYVDGIPKLVIRKAPEGPPLIVVEPFELVLPSRPEEVRHRIAAALSSMGWGPEVDTYGRTLQSDHDSRQR